MIDPVGLTAEAALEALAAGETTALELTEAYLARCEDDLTRQPSEYLATLGISGFLLVLDRLPLAMT